jgi:hypothetical protein
MNSMSNFVDENTKIKSEERKLTMWHLLKNETFNNGTLIVIALVKGFIEKH